MQKEAEQNKLVDQKVRRAIDQVLIKHIERLLGTSYGIGALPMNTATISCLVLLVERENEIETFPSTPPERYTHETLLEGLVELGLEPDGDLQTALQDMIQKGYIEVTPDGTFLAKKPATTMIQLFDRIFPGMPGMNFVAYLVQTMDEVVSGRKDLVSGISQLDQTLQMHGVPLSKQTTRRQGVGQKPSEKVTTRGKGKGPSIQAKTPSEFFRRLQAGKMFQRSPQPAGQPRILTAAGEARQFEIKELFSLKEDKSTAAAAAPTETLQLHEPEISKEEPLKTDQEKSPLEPPPSAESERPYEDVETLLKKAPDTLSQPDSEQQDLAAETADAHAVLEDVPPEQEMPLISEPVVQEAGLLTDTEEAFETKPDQTEEAASAVETEHETDIVSEEHETIGADDTVERRIAAFEEDLAMLCPVCKTGKIVEKRTAKGKLFYQCPNKDCIFVSWGKPYHIVCPQCKNPFLVETTDRNGKTILKCPRATCRHQQNLPWESTDTPVEDMASASRPVTKSRVIARRPRRKVVRRRVVRRKR
ncbi:MAG: hypothetical protein JRJ42_00330 [Deltaproteobacteria bacterium]|nr:hypothetical protein [Deltaproteobacteria bacterium]MBW2018442.1 hypothetical protein [Deltaproteobacteria bacterium]MBW2073729.1 hypothetical protein [Deltaproteobacteria bacterium]